MNALVITDEIWTRCDSCGLHYDEDGNVTFEQPSRKSINTESGTCSRCVAELTRLGVPLIDERLKEILSGGGVDKEHALAISVDHESNSKDRAEAQHGQLTQKPVCSRPAAQFISKSFQTSTASIEGHAAFDLGLPLVLAFKPSQNEHRTQDG